MADVMLNEIQSESLLNLLTSLASEDDPLAPTRINSLDAYCCSTSSKPGSPHSPLKRGDVIEIQGPPASGKTHLVYHLLATCVLPRVYRSVSLHGWQKAAILFDTDGSFDIRRFEQVLADRLRNLVNAEEISTIIGPSFSRLALVRATSTMQLAVSILNSPSYLARLFPGLELGLLVVDSLSTFYWPDRFTTERLTAGSPNDQPPVMSNRFQNVAMALQKICSTLSPVIVLTNWGLTPTSRTSGTPTYYRQHLNPWPDPFSLAAEGESGQCVWVPNLTTARIFIDYHITTTSSPAGAHAEDEQKFTGKLRRPGVETEGRMDFTICREGVHFQ